MGFQFARIETFSRTGTSQRRTVQEICDEAARVPGSSPHVFNPQQPTILHGIDPSEIPARIDDLVKAARKKTRGQGRGNAVRKDTHVLAGCVMSHPAMCNDLDVDPAARAEYEAWRADAVEVMKSEAERLGWKLVSVVEHTDESHPHLHGLFVVDLDAPGASMRLDIRERHPGHAAVDPTAPPKERTVQYRQAMKDWQDHIHKSLSQHHGLTRIGPARRRLTRAEWLLEQQQAQALAAAKEAAETVIAEAETKASEIVATAETEARALRRDATIEAAALRSEAAADRAAAAIDRAAAAEDRTLAGRLRAELEKLIDRYAQMIESGRPILNALAERLDEAAERLGLRPR